MSNSKDYRQELKLFIEGGRDDNFRHLSHATYVVKTEDMFGNEIYGIQYHKTVVFGIYEYGNYFFNNGGYFTVTTKKRINDALCKIDDSHQIVQRNFNWLIGRKKIEFGFMMFDVNNNMQDCERLDCWGKPVQDVTDKTTKILNSYLSKV